MKVYNDENNVNIVQTIASASTLIGSLSTIAKEYVISKFPKNYFKHVYIDTSETVVQQNRNSAYNDLANKIPYPSLGITPEISIDQPIGGMEKSMHLSSPNLYVRKNAIREYQKLVIDPEDKFSITYTGDYITTNFNFRIITETFIQNADVVFFLKSKFQNDFFQYLNNQQLQTEVPKSFIKFIADIKGLDLDNPDDLDELRLYLIGTGKRPETIQKRKSLSTGKTCFFVNDTVNLLTLISDIDCPASVNRDAQVESEYVITFRMQISTYLPNAFILSTSKSTLKQLQESTINDLSTDSGQFEDGQTTSISITLGDVLSKRDVVYFNDNSGQQQIGHLVHYDKYTYTINSGKIEHLILPELNEEYNKIHQYAVEKLNVDTSSLITVKIFTKDGRLADDRYSFNSDTGLLTISAGLIDDVVISTYVNRVMFESVKKAMLLDKDYFSDGVLTKVHLNIAGDDLVVNVNKFEDKKSIYSSDIDKSLRISTPYGIGYIDLLDDSEGDSYKVCLGYDTENNPIIKQFNTRRS